ncbi:glycosyltransferase family 1 protein [Burkholderia sp. BCC1644]|uniref:glycosyltransferase family 4 protein n=1 Tax=Burkholderia sp. BCC1644 TaxID=2676293 RepID=UPI001FC84FBA|nr:glycosyltransferase family 1 protein [Burkholderia sp. BCC1644]
MALSPAKRPHAPPNRALLIDVSIIASHDAGTGIQRVVKSLALDLLKSPPAGFEIRLVRATRAQPYRYANAWQASLTGSEVVEEDEHVRVSSGDLFLGLDLTSRILPRRHAELLHWRAQGVRCAFIVYDLLPILHPDWFTPRARRSYRHWLSTLAVQADALFCISKSVSDEMRDCLHRRFGFATDEIATHWFHLGSAPLVDTSPKSTAKSKQSPVKNYGGGPTTLMVGTIEPRKGHAQVLDAFDRLWRDGFDGSLVIAGKPGWQINPLAERLKHHAEAGKRLFWLSEVDDHELERLYAELDGLLMASEAEGFGLPLVEAARYGMPIFARDLPVFREIAGAHASFFTASNGSELAPQLAKWLTEVQSGTATASKGMNVQTWNASANQLRALLASLR